MNMYIDFVIEQYYIQTDTLYLIQNMKIDLFILKSIWDLNNFLKKSDMLLSIFISYHAPEANSNSWPPDFRW